MVVAVVATSTCRQGHSRRSAPNQYGINGTIDRNVSRLPLDLNRNEEGKMGICCRTRIIRNIRVSIFGRLSRLYPGDTLRSGIAEGTRPKLW